ncbi:MAG TPA: hypothetical protein VK633_02335 [Verrucomicrobiae bacterium]|nr:hypothetical protein [Verrucomicrobiae bacterium]
MEWNIQARAQACQACKKPFADKESFHTLLFDQKGGYERCDVCQSCWTNQFSQGALDRKGFVSYWQSVYTVPPAAPPEANLKETAETLLRKIMERNDPKFGPTLYILAAMLERKRILKVKTQLSREGRRLFLYEHSKTGDLFQILDPNLQLDQLEAVQHEVLHLLQHGLEAAEGEGVSNRSEPASAERENGPEAETMPQTVTSEAGVI